MLLLESTDVADRATKKPSSSATCGEEVFPPVARGVTVEVFLRVSCDGGIVVPSVVVVVGTVSFPVGDDSSTYEVTADVVVVTDAVSLRVRAGDRGSVVDVLTVAIRGSSRG